MAEKLKKLWGALNSLEKLLCYGAFILLTLMPIAEVVARLCKTGIPSSSGLISNLLLVSGLIAGMITTKTGEHLSIALVHYITGEKIKKLLSVVTGLISLFISVILFWCGLSFFKNGLNPEFLWFIPVHLFGLIIPLGFAVITWRFARAIPFRGPAWLIAAAAGLLGTFCALPAVSRVFWGYDPPIFILDLTDFLYSFIFTFQGPAAALLILSALAGTPLFTVIGGLALIVMVTSGGQPEAVTIQIYSALTDSSIAAIPIFTLTGFFLSESKAGERLVQAFRSLFCWFPGGMIVATVIICAFFTSFTGASGVTILALGGILYIILSEKSNYPDKFSVGLLTSVGGIGLLFPPSLPVILVGTTTRTNIIHLFLGALIPGIILVIAMIVFGITASIRIKIPTEPFDLRKTGTALKASLGEILLPFFLIAGYFTGIMTLLEVSAVSVLYVFILETLIHRDIKLSEVPRVFSKAVPIIGGVLSIIALAKALSYAIVFTQIPDNLAFWMQEAIRSRWLFLLILNLALLVVGCLMDIFSAILVVLPLITPLGEAYGIDPVHLGIIFITNLEVGFLTPPVGLNLFLASYRFKKPFVEICRYVFPFLIIQLVVVLLVTYVPWLSTFLTGFF
jgi:tripartite ATP-independent transporter DctM subunit